MGSVLRSIMFTPQPTCTASDPAVSDNACRGQTIMRNMSNIPPIKIEPFKVACSSCNLRELCLPVGLSKSNLDQLDALVATRRTVSRGDTLFRTGDSFMSLYAVRTGFF